MQMGAELEQKKGVSGDDLIRIQSAVLEYQKTIKTVELEIVDSYIAETLDETLVFAEILKLQNQADRDNIILPSFLELAVDLIENPSLADEPNTKNF